MKIVICEQDGIDSFENLAREFFSKILDMSFDECLVTDESSLLDFIPFCDEVEQYLDAIDIEYGIKLEKAGVTLLDIFRQIEAEKMMRNIH